MRNHMPQKKLQLRLKMNLLILLFVMFSSLNSLPTRAAEQSALSFYVFGDLAEKAAYDQLISAFQKKHSDIAINLVYTPGEDEIHATNGEDAYRSRLSLDYASARPPDVFLMNYREYGIFGERNQLEPLGPHLAQSQVIQPGDFYPQALEAFTRNNVLDCIPQNLSGTVIYYNKDLFKKASLDFPKADWTWDDFLKTAQALTIPADKQFGFGADPSLTRLLPFIWQQGGEVTDSPPTKLVIDTPETRTAMQWFVDLQGKYHVTPDEAEATAQNVQDRFLAGTEGMLMFSRRLVPSLRQAKFDWDVAPLPRNKQAATLLYSDGYCMSRMSNNKAAAWTLIEYANSPEGQTLLAQSGRTVPSLKAVANSPAFLDPSAKPQNSRLFLDLIPTLRLAPLLPNYADVEEAVNQGLEGAFYGDQSVDAAIKAIKDDIQ